MCGLVGIAGDLNFNDEKRMERLLVLDWFRGRDSTGLAAIRNNGDVKLAKITSHPYDLFDMGRYKEAMNANQSCAFIGHNRAATRGVVNHANAHPFHFDHIIGAHNGTLWPGSHRELEKALGEDYPVDSQAIIAAIAVLGIEETMSLLEGAYALTYFNLNDGTLNFIRNKERNLWYSTTKSKDHLVWASEWGMIKAALYESEAIIARDEDGHGFFEFQEDVHYSYDIRSLKAGKVVPKPKCKKMEGKKVAPFGGRMMSRIGAHNGRGSTQQRQSDPFKREVGEDGTSRLGSTTSMTQFPSSEGDGHTLVEVPFLNIEATNDDPFGGEISKEKFEIMSKNGCGLCEADIEWGDDGVVVWERTDTVICGRCSGLEGKSRIYTTRPLTIAA